jgi:hypothetical protein
MKPGHNDRSFFSSCLPVVAALCLLPSFAAAQTNKKPSAPAAAPAKPAAAPKAPAAAPKPSLPAPRTNTTGTTGVHPGTTGAGTRVPTTTPTTRGATGTTGTAARGATGTSAVRGATTTTGRGTTNTALGGHGAAAAGTTSVHGGTVAPHSLGAGAGRAPALSRTVQTRSGNNVGFDKRGNVRTIEGHGMTVNRGISGNRRVVTERNGQRFVSNGRRGGYAERPYRTYGGRSYYQRTYVYGGRSYARVYGRFGYRGGYYYRYYPTYYYHPVYYGWAYNPWPAPVTYGWGWGGAPWYGYYGVYFQPYPVYPYAALWLTDYLVAANLQAAYEAGQADAAGGSASVERSSDPAYGGGYEPASDSASAAKLTPELKQLIAEEVKAEIAAEKAAAGAGTSGSAAPAATGDERPAALDPAFKIFVVSADLDVSTDDGQDCTLSTGDVVERIDADAGSDNGVHVRVRAGKATDCKLDSKPQVDLNDLQEMHNHFREQVDAGLENLAKNAGKNGLPAAPDTGTTGGAPPVPDSTAAAQLQQQQKDADQAEAEAQQDASAPPQN